MDVNFKRFLKIHIPALIIAVPYIVMFGLGVTCPIRYVSGLPCPACGLTRAVLCLLRLDLAGSFRMYPLAVPVIASIYVIIHKKFKIFDQKRVYIPAYALLIINFTVYLVRLGFGVIP